MLITWQRAKSDFYIIKDFQILTLLGRKAETRKEDSLKSFLNQNFKKVINSQKAFTK